MPWRTPRRHDATTPRRHDATTQASDYNALSHELRTDVSGGEGGALLTTQYVVRSYPAIAIEYDYEPLNASTYYTQTFEHFLGGTVSRWSPETNELVTLYDMFGEVTASRRTRHGRSVRRIIHRHSSPKHYIAHDLSRVRRDALSLAWRARTTPHTRTDYFSPDSDVVRSSTWTTSDVHCVGDDDSQYLTDVLDWAHVSSIAVGVENNYVRRGVVTFPRAVILLVAIREGKQTFYFPFFALRSDLCATCSLSRFSGSHAHHAMPSSALRPISHLSHPGRRPAQPEHGRLAAPGRRPRAAVDALVEPRFVRL